MAFYSHIPFLVLILSVAAAEPLDDDPVSHLQRGDRYFSSADNWMALREYEAAYKLRPSGYEEILRMVRIYNDLGRTQLGWSDCARIYYTSAIAYAESLYKHFPDMAETRFMYALAHGSLLPFSGVKERIRIVKLVRDNARRALELDSTFSMTYVLLGIFEREGSKLGWMERGFVRIVFGEDISGSLQQSEAYLLTALRHDPKNPFALYELHWTYNEMGDTARALASLQRVLELQPRSARELCQAQEAREDIKQLLKDR